MVTRIQGAAQECCGANAKARKWVLGPFTHGARHEQRENGERGRKCRQVGNENYFSVCHHWETTVGGCV